MPELLDRLSAANVLLVHGPRSFEVSGASRMLAHIGPRIRVRHWDEFSPNPDAGDLERGLAVVRSVRPDIVIGVGGGSSMDMAKLLCALEDAPAHDLDALIKAEIPVSARRMRLALVPTTAGSGSESTHFAVVYIGDVKYSVAGPALLPDIAIIDPALSESTSLYQRAASGMDAIAHGVESLWAIAGSPESRNLALRGLRLLLSAIEDFVKDPLPGSAAAMAMGSHLAGGAINTSKTTAAHALSYGITRRYGVSHGHAVSLTLGAFMDAHAQAQAADLRSPDRLSAHRQAMEDIAGLLGASDPSESGRRFTDLARRVGLPMGLSAIGVTRPSEIRGLAMAVNGQRLANNPVRFSVDELAGLLTRWC
jgi:alcohol dehydrogenase class IV